MAKKKKLTVMVAVMLTPEMLTKLQEITDKLEVSNSEYIRDLLERKLYEKQLIKEEK
mgnify:CR=1 FL=1